MQRYNPKEIEPKWQSIWDETGVYTTDFNSPKPKYLAMSMFNYPSGAGIHIGHAMNYTISDVKARFKRQQGFESYHPVGWDAFGLPAENYAIKAGVSPQESMASIIPMYHKQYKAMGWSNDWEKEIATHLPEYYKWTQWIFCEMYRHGLVYQDTRMQWWCEIDNSVLANEQVIDGKCWRHDGPDDPPVQKKEVKQWFFKITDYADELLEATETLDWSESVKLAQKNWIGKSTGAEIDFEVKSQSNKECLVIHGITGHNQENWFPWLKSTLDKKGWNVAVPNLPNTDHPKIVEWQAALAHDFKGSSTIVGHSLGAPAALNLIQSSNKKVDKLILVAPVNPKQKWQALKANYPNVDWDIVKEFADIHFDWQKIQQLTKSIVIYYSDNDPYIPPESVDFYKQHLPNVVFKYMPGKSHFNSGAGITEFPEILDDITPSVKVFTTRIDTLFSGAFLVLAPEHELVQSITTDAQKQAVADYVVATQKKSEVERQADKEKSGIFTGAYAINPANSKEIPVWVGDFVLASYGTGAVFGDIHDERDFEFLKKFDISAEPTVVPEDKAEAKKVLAKEYPYIGEGILINSGKFTGMRSQEAREKITDWLAKQGKATKKVNYRMRDWSVSRQRYWGAPIPIIDCPTCGPQLVPDEQLPVVLPELDDFQPSGDGRSALARATDWLKADCPKCGGPAERETDTLDTYVDSSFYMYRYLDPHNQQQIFDSAVVKKWEPVDFYNGADHATAHLLYARFIGHFFKKIGLVDEPEPFKQFVFNGKVVAADGRGFSKTLGNGPDPLDIINQGYGADAIRTYLMFAAPLELGSRWDPQGVPGTYRFLSRIWNLVQEYAESKPIELSESAVSDIRRATHAMIKKVTEDQEANHYNTAIAAAMTCVNDFYLFKAKKFGQNKVWQESLAALVACIAPFAPHIAEELWHRLGHSITVHRDSWPKYDEKYLAKDSVTIVVQVNGKLRGEVEVAVDAPEDNVVEAAKANQNVAAHLSGDVKKTIYVRNKLVNFVF